MFTKSQSKNVKLESDQQDLKLSSHDEYSIGNIYILDVVASPYAGGVHLNPPLKLMIFIVCMLLKCLYIIHQGFIQDFRVGGGGIKCVRKHVTRALMTFWKFNCILT